jgi:hypothetical protein
VVWVVRSMSDPPTTAISARQPAAAGPSAAPATTDEVARHRDPAGPDEVAGPRDPAGPDEVAATAPAERTPTETPAEPPEPGPSQVLLAGVPVPVSASHGPFDVTGGRAIGYSHEREGVALAALHLLLRVDEVVGSEVFGPTIDEQLIGRPADIEALRSRTWERYTAAAALQGVTDGGPLRHDLRMEPVGWLATVDGEHATADLLLVGPDLRGRATTMSVRADLERTEGGWLLVAPPGGTWDDAVTIRAPAAGYAPWTEVGP